MGGESELAGGTTQGVDAINASVREQQAQPIVSAEDHPGPATPPSRPTRPQQAEQTPGSPAVSGAHTAAQIGRQDQPGEKPIISHIDDPDQRSEAERAALEDVAEQVDIEIASLAAEQAAADFENGAQRRNIAERILDENNYLLNEENKQTFNQEYFRYFDELTQRRRDDEPMITAASEVQEATPQVGKPDRNDPDQVAQRIREILESAQKRPTRQTARQVRPRGQRTETTVEPGIKVIDSPDQDTLGGKLFPGRVSPIAGGKGYEYIAVAPKAGSQGKETRAVVRFKLRDPKLLAQKVPGSINQDPKSGIFRYILGVGGERQVTNLKTKNLKEAEAKAREIFARLADSEPELAAQARERQRGVAPTNKKTAERLARQEWERIQRDEPELASQILTAGRRGRKPKGKRYIARIGGTTDTRKHLGVFDTLEEAREARKKALAAQQAAQPERTPANPAIPPQATPLEDVTFLDVGPGVREKIEKRFADRPDILSMIRSLDDTVRGDFTTSPLWTRFRFTVGQTMLTGRKGVSEGQRKAILALSNDEAMSLAGQAYVDALEYFANTPEDTINKQVNSYQEQAGFMNVSVGEILLLDHKTFKTGANLALQDVREFLKNNPLSIDQILAARDESQQERITAEAILSDGKKIDEVMTDIYRQYVGGVQFALPLIANKPSEHRGIAFMESFVDLLIRNAEISPLTLDERKRWNALVLDANRQGLDPYAYVRRQAPDLFDKLAIPWDSYRKSLGRIIKALDTEEQKAFPVADNLPTWVQELNKVQSTPSTASPQFIFNSEKLGVSHAKALAENGPSAEHLELVNRLANTRWGARVTIDYSPTRRTGGGAFVTKPQPVSRQQARNVLGEQAYDEAVKQNQALSVAVDSRGDPDTGRIYITIHTPEAQASGERLAQGIYAIIGEYFRQRRPGIYRKIEAWHRQEDLSGHPLIEFAQAMALEETEYPGVSKLPGDIILQAQRLFSSQGNLPGIDDLIRDWGRPVTATAEFAQQARRSKIDPKLQQQAKDHFGVTGDVREAGYMLPDGTLLDLSGRHYASGYQKKGDRYVPKRGQPDYLEKQRSTDHRELEGLSEKGGTEGMNEFMDKTGAVRMNIDPLLKNLSFDSVGIPGDKQLERIISMTNRFKPDSVAIDLSYPNGDVFDSVILHNPTGLDVRKFYNQGTNQSAQQARPAEIDTRVPDVQFEINESRDPDEVRAEIDRAEAAEEITAPVAKLLRILTQEIDPDFSSNSMLEVFNTIKEISGELAEKEGLAKEDKDGKPINYNVLGETTHIAFGDWSETAIKLLKGADADTVMEEWYHRFFFRLPDSDPGKQAFIDWWAKQPQAFRDEVTEGQPDNIDEGFAKLGRDWFFAQGKHEAIGAGPIEKLFNRAKQALKILLDRIKKLAGYSIPKKVTDVFARAVGVSPGPTTTAGATVRKALQARQDKALPPRARQQEIAATKRAIVDHPTYANEMETVERAGRILPGEQFVMGETLPGEVKTFLEGRGHLRRHFIVNKTAKDRPGALPWDEALEIARREGDQDIGTDIDAFLELVEAKFAVAGRKQIIPTVLERAEADPEVALLTRRLEMLQGGETLEHINQQLEEQMLEMTGGVRQPELFDDFLVKGVEIKSPEHQAVRMLKALRRQQKRRNVKKDIRRATGQVRPSRDVVADEAKLLSDMLEVAENSSAKGYQAGELHREANVNETLDFIRKHLPAPVQAKALAALKGIRTKSGKRKLAETIKKVQDQFAHREALGALNNLLNKVTGRAGNKLLPEFRGKLQEMLQGLTEKSTAAATKRRLEGLLRAAELGEERITDPRIKAAQSRLDEANKTVLRDMTTEGIKELTQALSLLIQLNRLKKKLVMGGQIRDFLGFRTEILESLRKLKDVRLWRKPGDPDLDPRKGKFRDWVDSSLGPVEMAKRIMGKAKGAWKQIFYDDVKVAQRKFLSIKQHAFDLLKQSAKVHNIKWNGAEIERLSRAVSGKKVTVREVKLASGETVRMTPAELIFLYNSLRDLDTQEQILNAGIVFKNKDIMKKTTNIDLSDIKRIRDAMNGVERAFADVMSLWMNNEGKQLTEEIFREMGESRELRDDYWPRRRSKNKVPENIKLADVGQVVADVTEAGVLKERTGSGSPVVIDDAFLLYFSHVDTIARANAYAMPIRNMKMVLGDVAIKRHLTRAFGTQMMDYWINRLVVLSQAGTNYGGAFQQILNKILQGFSKSVLGWNPSPRLKQFGGLFPASTIVGLQVFKKWAASFGKLDSIIKELEELSPEIRERYDIHAVHLASNLFEDHRPMFGRQRLGDRSLNGLQTSDKRIVAAIYLSALEKTKGNKEAAARLTEETVNQTQNITSEMDMSGFALRSKQGGVFTKGLVLFKSNAERMQNMVRQGVYEWRHSDKTAADNKKLAGILAAVMIGNAGTSVVVSQLIRTAVQSLRGDEPDEDEANVIGKVLNFSKSLVLENLGNLYVVDKLANLVDAAFDEKFWWRTTGQGPFERIAVDTVGSVKELADAFEAMLNNSVFEAGPRRGQPKGPILAGRGLMGLAQAVSQVVGFPLFPLRLSEAALERATKPSTASGGSDSSTRTRRTRPTRSRPTRSRPSRTRTR